MLDTVKNLVDFVKTLVLGLVGGCFDLVRDNVKILLLAGLVIVGLHFAGLAAYFVWVAVAAGAWIGLPVVKGFVEKLLK